MLAHGLHAIGGGESVLIRSSVPLGFGAWRPLGTDLEAVAAAVRGWLSAIPA
jgi:hypothetical protein